MLFDYDHPAAWPTDVVALLDEHRPTLEDWVTERRFASPYEYDEIIGELGETLRPHEIMAWHNTRLTAREAADILSAGMHLPSVETLIRRIDSALAEGAISPAVAEGFKRRHQADSPTRVGRIWFLFTRPHNDDGIEDFLRFWGGEALYAAIDRDPDLGPALRSVGVPSVVEAAIPIRNFTDSLGFESHIAKQFCAWRAGRSYNGVPHDRLLVPLGPAHVRRIVTCNDPSFVGLTGCDRYFEPLGLTEER
ncbi:hypothetical protein GCM10023219_20860 [Stakelama sediminis]|uniref:Uncharacterized protein n=1 Tax=Stakelama sediminis TaxID=463200 RepID=A0A840Z2M4_9SPHN|nr:hypothetical protein [Stakelama sediminis]MBB5719956.1 hypothetical protein [Stakelama sediminis]